MAKPRRGGERGGKKTLPQGVTAQEKSGMKVGNDVYEFEGELNYGENDPRVTKFARPVLEAWENKRRSNKIEYAYCVDVDGDVIGTEAKGGKGSVRVPLKFHMQPDSTFTHIHPRPEGSGYLGGTFSDADLNNFAKGNNRTARAAAKEGTYSLSKLSNFDKNGFMSFVKASDSEFEKAVRASNKEIDSLYLNAKLSYSDYTKQRAKSFNTALINLHEKYRQNQEKYGYVYTLEKI